MKNTDLLSIKRTFTKQYSQYYCGLACLASIVKYHGGDIKQEKLRAMSGTGLNGTSMLGLYQAAQKLGFDTEGFKTDIEYLKKINTPVILHVLKEIHLEHYIVCYGYENGQFMIGDPAWGIQCYLPEELDAVWKSKTLLHLEPNSEFLVRKSFSHQKFNWYKDILKEDLPVLLVAAFLGIIFSILGIATAIYLQKLIDVILPQGDRSFLLLTLAFFLAILVIRSIIGYIRVLLLVNQGKDLNIRMISMFFGKLLYLPMSFFDGTSTGDLVGRLNDTQRIQKVVVYLFSSIFVDIFVAVSSLVYIFMISSSSGLLALVGIPVFILLAVKYNKQVITCQQNLMQTYAMTESKYIDTIQGIKVIKSSNRESLFSKSVNAMYELFQGKIYDLAIMSNKINLRAQLGQVLILCGIISWTSILVLRDQITLGELMAIVSVTGSFITSLINLTMANIQLQEARVALDRMYEYASENPEYEVSEYYDIKKDSAIQTIQIQDIHFRFPGKPLLLHNINMTFELGKISTIFGEIGCGKSTLLAILQRFYDFESGDVLINGCSWKSIPTPVWRDTTEIIAQQIKLFNGTILENIALQDKIDAEHVLAFCKETGIDDFIQEFQQGYATIVNENGTNLSGGQQQLIALARALYKQPQVLLLDEVTSAMDRRTEQFVFQLLSNLKNKMIIILVTHRIHLASKTDQIYLIENGQVTASGDHHDLLQIDSFYKEAFMDMIPA